MEEKLTPYEWLRVIFYLVVTVGGFFASMWILSVMFSPDPYQKAKENYKVENIMSTKPVIKHDITVETNVVVSDGVTRRTMKSKIVADTITHNMIRTINSNMLNATYHMVDTRQKEVNSDSKYWSRNVIPVNREK
jgi:glycerol uptake facilitator-like aquaporin